MQKRCQASAEFVIVLGIALIVLLSILAFNQKTFTTSYTQFQSAKAQVALDDIANAAERLYQQGTGSKTRIFITMPNEVQFSLISNNTLRINMFAGTTNRDFYRGLPFNVTGTVPVAEGGYWLSLEARKDSVVVMIENVTA